MKSHLLSSSQIQWELNALIGTDAYVTQSVLEFLEFLTPI